MKCSIAIDNSTFTNILEVPRPEIKCLPHEKIHYDTVTFKLLDSCSGYRKYFIHWSERRDPRDICIKIAYGTNVDTWSLYSAQMIRVNFSNINIRNDNTGIISFDVMYASMSYTHDKHDGGKDL